VRDLEFVKFRVYGTYVYRHAIASLCKISLKSDYQLPSYDQKTILKMAASAILNFKNCHIWLRDCHRVPNWHLYTKISSKSDYF